MGRHADGPVGTIDRMPTVLDQIIAAHRKAALADKRWLDATMTAAFEAPDPRDFRGLLRVAATRTGRPAVIAEIKRRSPSKGDLAPDLDPATLARAYQSAGASALSVLTDAEFFGGSAADLAAARAAAPDLPILRKDFTVDGRDVADARAMGADAVLLIVAALNPGDLARLRNLADGLGLAAVLEVHDDDEVAIALKAGATIIGVNQRDLRTFEVDPTRAARLAALIPDGVMKIAESGIHTPDQVDALAEAGYDAILVGEQLVTAPDPAAALRTLRGEPS
ncbi:MAG: indole-3-glycerol phosphate synthase [Actinomycetota bacterium]|jgi:indole-3-glycerol phosphate synthase|nr:indole-3-glycerol phosphate synthase [Actinomycetota bacterium]